MKLKLSFIPFKADEKNYCNQVEITFLNKDIKEKVGGAG